VAVDVRVKVPLAFSLLLPGVGPLTTPDPLSVADQVSVVLVSFHPFALATGVGEPVTPGPVLSRVYDACPLLVLPVQVFCELKLGDAEAVTDCTPSPAAATEANVHEVLAVDDC
jgi:hypothetical protein